MLASVMRARPYPSIFDRWPGVKRHATGNRQPAPVPKKPEMKSETIFVKSCAVKPLSDRPPSRDVAVPKRPWCPECGVRPYLTEPSGESYSRDERDVRRSGA